MYRCVFLAGGDVILINDSDDETDEQGDQGSTASDIILISDSEEELMQQQYDDSLDVKGKFPLVRPCCFIRSFHHFTMWNNVFMVPQGNNKHIIIPSVLFLNL